MQELQPLVLPTKGLIGENKAMQEARMINVYAQLRGLRRFPLISGSKLLYGKDKLPKTCNSPHTVIMLGLEKVRGREELFGKGYTLLRIVDETLRNEKK